MDGFEVPDSGLGSRPPTESSCAWRPDSASARTPLSASGNCTTPRAVEPAGVATARPRLVNSATIGEDAVVPP